MTPLERSLLHEACAEREPRLILRTLTRVDAGRWWRNSPLWLAIEGGNLILFAVARRKYLERVPLADCHASQYIHSSGQLLIAPTETPSIRHIEMTPGDALRVLDAMGVPAP